MALTLVVGLLLAFGRWASDERTPMMGFAHVVRGYLPAGWVLAIEYGVLVAMVAAIIRADRTGELFSSVETLTWLGGISLFTAGLYHNGDLRSTVWAASVNGYGTFTRFLDKPSQAHLALLLSVWPMAYALIVVTSSFVGIMGWKRSFLRWRWVLHAAFLIAVTASWIMFVLWPGIMKYDSSWLAESMGVLPVLVVTLALVRDADRKLHCVNLIAAVWLATAMIHRFDEPIFVNTTIRWMRVIFHPLILGDLLILLGSIAGLFSTHEQPPRS